MAQENRFLMKEKKSAIILKINRSRKAKRKITIKSGRKLKRVSYPNIVQTSLMDILLEFLGRETGSPKRFCFFLKTILIRLAKASIRCKEWVKEKLQMRATSKAWCYLPQTTF